MRLDPEPTLPGAEPISRRQAVARVVSALGATLSAPTVAALLAACERGERAARPTASALSEEQTEMLATIAEHILPQTETPGARAVGVHEFIAEMMSEYYPPEEREIFLAGLAGIDERARRAHGRSFRECTPDQQVAILGALDRETLEKRDESEPQTEQEITERTTPGSTGSPLPPDAAQDTIRWEVDVPQPARTEAPFWRTMKELTLVGYYTSEPGATEELRHEPVPGRYEGCVPYAQIGRAWAV